MIVSEKRFWTGFYIAADERDVEQNVKKGIKELCTYSNPQLNGYLIFSFIDYDQTTPNHSGGIVIVRVSVKSVIVDMIF